MPHLDRICEHAAVNEVGCPYVSGARATMLRKAMIWGADEFLFLDDDVSWEPEDLNKLLLTEGDVVGGTYRYKIDEERYMGGPLWGPDGRAPVREDGAVEALNLPAGFLKVTRKAVDLFMERFPDLVIDADHEGFRSPDLFNHGAFQGVWWGEDYAFCRRWREIGGSIWLLPDLNIDHHGRDQVWKGNFHRFLLRHATEAA